MSVFNIRLRRGAVLHLLLLGFFLLASPSSLPSASELVIEAQSAEEIVLLEELAHWIDPGEDLASLRDAIRERRQSFDVFREFHSEKLRSARIGVLPFGASILRTAERHRLDALLLASIVEVESGFDPDAVSHRGATGLMQVMPWTVDAESRAGLYDPDHNLDAGARYLQGLLRRYGGDLELALAAYNAGPANVRRYGGVPPFRETRRYVEKVLEIYVDHHRQVWRESETVPSGGSRGGDTADQLARM